MDLSRLAAAACAVALHAAVIVGALRLADAPLQQGVRPIEVALIEGPSEPARSELSADAQTSVEPGAREAPPPRSEMQAVAPPATPAQAMHAESLPSPTVPPTEPPTEPPTKPPTAPPPPPLPPERVLPPEPAAPDAKPQPPAPATQAPRPTREKPTVRRPPPRETAQPERPSLRPSPPPEAPPAEPAAQAAPTVAATSPDVPPRTDRQPSSPAASAPPSATAASDSRAADAAPRAAGAGATGTPSVPPAAASADATPRRTGPRVDASWRGNTPPPYPGAARRMGDEGEVRLDVHVGADGSVLDVRLRQSSGSPLLDRTAIETVKRWRFDPATVDGRPVAAWYHDWRWVFRLEG